MSLPLLLDKEVPWFGASEVHLLPSIQGGIMLVMATRIPNSLLALYLDHKLRCISFDGGALSISEIVLDYPDSLTGGQMGGVSPEPFADACVYLQSRRLVVYEVSKQAASKYWLTDMGNLQEIAKSAVWSSSEKKHLVVQIEDTTRFDAGLMDVRLRAFDLSQGQPIALGKLEPGSAPPRDFGWHAGRGIVVVIKSGILEVLGADLVRVDDHPLVGVALEVSQRGFPLVAVRLHSTLPRAVLVTATPRAKTGRYFHMFVADWTDPNAPSCIHVATTLVAHRLLLGDFSPKGANFAFAVDSDEEMAFYLLSSEAPYQIRWLGNVNSSQGSWWSCSPISLVVMDERGRLLRWLVDERV